MRNDIKEKLESVKTKEEFMAVVEEYGLNELSDEELDSVVAGVDFECEAGYIKVNNRCQKN